MELTLKMFLIVCPLVFIGGFVDAIAGGGGLITLPAMMIAGLPAHQAIATNKLSVACGTTLTTVKFWKNGMINMKVGIPTVAATLIGASLGAKISMMVPDSVIQKMLFVILPVVAIIVMNKKLFHDNPEAEIRFDRRTVITMCIIAFIIGMYDAFYGPGTGTFLIICFTIFNKLSIRQANGQAKLINLTSNLTSLTIYLLHGQVLIPLGLAGAASNMLGNYIGASLVMKNGSRIVKPMILVVLSLLFLKLLGVY